jgi:hypothetical protein
MATDIREMFISPYVTRATDLSHPITERGRLWPWYVSRMPQQSILYIIAWYFQLKHYCYNVIRSTPVSMVTPRGLNLINARSTFPRPSRFQRYQIWPDSSQENQNLF